MPKEELQSNGQSENRPELSNKIKRVPGEGLFMSVSKKAEKITTALYMVTDLISPEDPMRHKIRQNSLLILSETRALSYAVSGDIYFHLARVIARAWEVVSLMEVSVVVGFISDMNYTVLKNALVDFISDLRNRQRIEGFNNIRDMKWNEGQAANLHLKSDFFKLGENDIQNIKDEAGKGEPGEFEKIEKLESKRIVHGQSFYKGHSKEMMSDRKVSYEKSKIDESAPKTDERKQKILSLVSEKKDISIADIVSFFKEYSQKTIQRDLATLVEAGKIKRTGEKRWSRYLFVS